MTPLKALKYRLDPTVAQAQLIHRHMGSCRFVYNLALEAKRAAYTGNRVNVSCYDLIRQLPELKNQCPWLKEVNSQSLQQAIINLDTAFNRFFKGQDNFPRFKKKMTKQSFNIPQNLKVEKDRVVFPKFKEGIKVVLHRPLKGVIKQATISKTPTGKYFISILCVTGEDCKTKKTIQEKNTIGIDVGIKSFLITSDGRTFDNPKFLKQSLSKLKYVQRRYSIYKGKRTKRKLARLHEKVANQRKDFLHKTSTVLLKNHESIAVEDLNIKGMIKNHYLAQSISDSGWSMFVTMLQYKAQWQGKNILKIGTFAPSSKTCSCCGHINKALTLKDRQWRCSSCGMWHDRDHNAAINIKTFALKNYLSGTDRKTRNELPTEVGVLTSETHSLQG